MREADAIVVEEIRRAGLYEKVWQAFAVLLPVRSVGVMGDERSYGITVAVRVVDSEDAMTADWARLPAEVLERISTRIVNEVAGREPRGVRHQLEAAEHDRVGIERAQDETDEQRCTRAIARSAYGLARRNRVSDRSRCEVLMQSEPASRGC